MEKQYNREEELVKKLLNEAGAEKPSADFKSRIMLAVEAKKPIKAYQPLIPIFIWYILGGIMISSVAGLYFIYADMSFTWNIDLQIPKFPDVPRIDLSRTMQLAIAFIALFLLEVPFLKRFVDRQYGV